MRRTTIGLQRRHLPQDAGHPTVDASISTWMPAGHLPGDALRSTPGIYYWMRVRRRCGCSDRARPRDRSARARPFALDSTSHRPVSLARGLPRRQRRRVARRSGRWRSEAVAVPNRIRRRGAPRFSHADQAVTVLREELLRTLLARLEMQPYPCGGKLGRAPGWRGTGGGAGGRDR